MISTSCRRRKSIPKLTLTVKNRFMTPFFGSKRNVQMTTSRFASKPALLDKEPPKLENQTPYSFEDSPLREASVIVNGQSSLNLHYLWGAISGVSVRADDRLGLAGSAYRFLTQIRELPKGEIRLFTPKGSAAYLVERSYQEAANSEAIQDFEQTCAKFAGNWH